MMKQVFDALFLGAGIFSHGAVFAVWRKNHALDSSMCVFLLVCRLWPPIVVGFLPRVFFLEDFYPEQNPTMQRSTELLSIASFQTNPNKIQNSTLKTIFIVFTYEVQYVYFCLGVYVFFREPPPLLKKNSY